MTDETIAVEATSEQWLALHVFIDHELLLHEEEVPDDQLEDIHAIESAVDDALSAEEGSV